MHSDDDDDLYEDVKLVLTNEGRFYAWVLRNLPDGINITASHWKCTLKFFYPPAEKLSLSQRISLRKYFYNRWIRCDRPFTDPTTSPKENPIMSIKLTFKTQHLLNGNPLDNHSKEAIYEAIAAEEKRLDKLREIKHQPKSLKAEIEAGEAALKALVDHLDGI